jgi:hypothetical protein
LRTLLLVAVEADVGLCGRGKNRVAFAMARVAIGAGNCVVVMPAAVPGESGIGEVTIDAISVLLRNGGARVRTEHDSRRPFLTSSYATGMITARPVAGFALQLAVTERGGRITWHSMFGAEYCQGCLVVVTLKTGIGALATVVWRFDLIGLLRRNDGRRRDGREGHR